MPLMSLAMAMVSLGLRLSYGALAGARVSLIGVLLVVSAGDLCVLLQHGLNGGDALLLVASLAYALYCTLLIIWLLRVPPLLLLYLQ
ncbi:EamA family transporter, partial [Pseudomonas sp. BJa5]|nr:EamA family transporter [Pseudomonas sp. BGr12]